MVHELGDILLFTLSAWKETGWGAFKRAFDEVYRIRLETEEIRDPDPVHFERARALRTLIACGHCDVDYSSGGSSISIGPPTLASLPYPGLPRAVLCGSRSPTTVKLLQRACSESGQSLRIVVENQRKRAPYAPLRVEIEAESYGALEVLARNFNISFAKTPPCWVFSIASGSVSEYIKQLEWSSPSELNWERQDFVARNLAFVPVNASVTKATTPGIRLSRYLDPTRLQWEYRLICDNRNAAVHPEWGRYAVLSASHQNTLLYDDGSGSLAVARGAPLPFFIARALVLCSGYAAKTVSARIVRSSIPENYAFDVYTGVPQDVVNVITRKLELREPLEPLTIQDVSK